MKKVKLFKPFVSWRAIVNVVRVLLSDQLAEGPQVKRFEKEFSEKFGLKNVVAVNSGTTALELAYELAKIEKGDEVITTVFTCTATNIPLIRRGAKIVFADIDKDLNINIEDVKNKVTPNTKAIVFVHFGGNNRGLKELIEFCRARSIKLIEDAAQAVGSDFWGKADFACVSLQAIKTLSSGDGGFLICKSDEDYKKARRLRWFGYDRDEKQKKGDIDLTEAGYKYHMNDITAAIGLGNLSVIDKVINHRKKLMNIYSEAGLNSHIWMTAVLGRDYASLSKRLKEHGFETGQHHYRNDKYTLFGGRQKLPVMDSIEDNYFFIPMHHAVSVKQAKKIVSLLQ
ncbi:MAG: aminotransferase class V-fold PLP-dependent enzyme [Candidatus Paceibacterota bacterium]|jgi:dTDP-4-amino-4,6-dideoxygalactose transaminase